MKNLASFLIVLCATAAPAVHAQGGSAPQQTPQPATVTSVLDSFYSIVERQVVSATEAMPEEKYSFAPTNGEFKGVRTFAEEWKHISFGNHIFLRPLMGQNVGVTCRVQDTNAPAAVKINRAILPH